MMSTVKRLFSKDYVLDTEKLFKLVSLISLFLFLVHLVFTGLKKGGRWDLYQAIAMADRWGTSDWGYSLGNIDGFLPSSPYFPGISLLALIAKSFSPYDVEVLIVLACISVLVLFYCLFFLYKSLDGKVSVYEFMVALLIFSYFLLPTWLDYATEFKPDTASLIFISLTIISLINLKNVYIKIFLVFSFSFLALLFKQQAIAPLVGIILALILSSEKIKNKYSYIFSITIGIATCLFFVFSIKGGWFYAIQSHGGRGFVFLKEKQNVLLFLFVISFVFFLAKYKRHDALCFLKEKLLYIIPALLWLSASMLGNINYGGNSGNTQVGFIFAMPFFLLFFEKIDKRVLYFCIFIFLFSFINTYIFGSPLSVYKSRVKKDVAISKFIQTYNPTNVLISGDSYLSVREINTFGLHEIDTWAHVRVGKNKTLVENDGNKFIEKISPDIIICSQGCSAFKSYGVDLSKLKFINITNIPNIDRDVLYIKLKD